METTRYGQQETLFKRIGDDGSMWLFVILPGGGWAIMRDDEPMVLGTSDRSSIDAGVKQFGKMARAAGRSPKCDPLVRRQLDRLDAARPRPIGASAGNLTLGDSNDAKRNPIFRKGIDPTSPVVVAGP
jgi:hypothetical protein